MGIARKLKRKSHNTHHRVEPLRRKGTFPNRKMSEVILDFAGPLLDIFDDGEYFKTVIGLAAICWNFSFLTEQEQQVQFDAVVDELGKDHPLLRLGIEDCVRMFSERKKVFFADDRRIVVGYEVGGEKDSRRLLVTSALANN